MNNMRRKIWPAGNMMLFEINFSQGASAKKKLHMPPKRAPRTRPMPILVWSFIG
jgi:hypothetical protein